MLPGYFKAQAHLVSFSQRQGVLAKPAPWGPSGWVLVKGFNLNYLDRDL